MDVSSIGSASTALSQAQTGDAVATLVMKKAMDIQAQSALQLLQALPQVASNPPNLGNSIDVKA
nr:YjfB family protein [Dechloromonas sp.]